jgi:hypothetical protein
MLGHVTIHGPAPHGAVRRSIAFNEPSSANRMKRRGKGWNPWRPNGFPRKKELVLRVHSYNADGQSEPKSPWRQEMSERNAVVAVYGTHIEAEGTVKELQRAGIDMRTLSIAGKDSHTDEHVVGYYNTGDRMKYWGKTGAFWGGFWGMLFGSAFFAIPGIGPVLVAGPLVAWIVGTLEGAAVFGGLSAIGAGLYGMGIPKDSVIQYEAALKTDKFLLMVHGTAAEVDKARDIIQSTRPVTMALHAAQVVATATK